ncbi:MAG: alpha-glucuronidase [Bacteroidales bacterium]|nr:alpha-glucuronidase [Bacteroidales bacterium]
MKKHFTLLTCLSLAFFGTMSAHDGSQLWLQGTAPTATSTLGIAKAELAQNWKGGEPEFCFAKIRKKDEPVGSFSITIKAGKPTIFSATDIGMLYGAYHLLRLQQIGANVTDTAFVEKPSYDIRILNHWDNLNGTIERGYAGRSIFWRNSADQMRRNADGEVNEEDLLQPKDAPEIPSLDHLRDYARANASIGINAFVPDNVNASPKVLTTEYLLEVKKMADVVRPYGMKTYLAINFASPMVIGGLSTADPLNKDVQRWWTAKVKEIYKLIPDFGGFLVKANSEGQPGPNDFGRTHAEGANMLAKALKPHGGIVMWRAFVYSPSDPDRAKQAYLEFQPLDGQFLDNVIIQIKNGPIDFQPREAYSALFGAMPHTRQMAEWQITQEYLGHSNHIAYLAPMWTEFLQQIKDIAHCPINNATSPARALTAISAVSNIGNSPSWCGNVMAQSNWYAFGRLAWNDELTPCQIAEEWARQTLFADCSDAAADKALASVKRMMLRSREAIVDYMMPLGLHHQFAWGHHYGPEPYCDIPGARPDWMPSYYAKADREGLGFNRSSTGSNATGQYPADYARVLDDIDACPYELLLWFHHVPWGKTIQHRYGDRVARESLWNALCHHYQHGLDEARAMQRDWEHCQGQIDADTFTDIQRRLRIQTRDAQWWKDGCLLYFQTFSCLPFPDDVEPAVHDLDKLRAIKLGITNFECPSQELLDSVR